MSDRDGSENRRVVIYHAGCFDGFCCAHLAHREWPDAEFVPARYGDDPPDVTGKHVLIADFSYPRAVMLGLIGAAASVVVLDHHKTAESDLAGLSEEANERFGVMTGLVVWFDMGKSGGRLTWEYLYGDDSPPWLVYYTEDRDLWIWKLPKSREVNAALRSYPMTFEEWDRLAGIGRLSDRWMGLLGEGAAILRSEGQTVDAQVRNAREVELAGYRVPCVNATTLVSETCGVLAAGKPFAVSWYERADGTRLVSLRSDPVGVDVSAVAKLFGGGGHRSASGFQVTGLLPWEVAT